MAKGTYISENLTQKQIDFMLMLDDYELDIFTLQEIKKIALPRFQDVNELLENLVHKKILSRIERGKYCRNNFRDENVIGCHLAPEAAIAYWSALNKHGLTEQFPNSIFIQTTKVRPEKNIFGVLYKFVVIAKSKRTGIQQEGFGNHAYLITDVEKTIVDCFDLPQYSGGYAELIRAFAQTNLNADKIIQYSKAVNNISLIKRMGFLAELLGKKEINSFIRFALEQVNEKYTLFDPQSSEKGEFVNDWRLRLNISREEILDICNKQY